LRCTSTDINIGWLSIEFICHEQNSIYLNPRFACYFLLVSCSITFHFHLISTSLKWFILFQAILTSFLQTLTNFRLDLTVLFFFVGFKIPLNTNSEEVAGKSCFTSNDHHLPWIRT
jgi:hypothetical protein